MHLHKVTAGFLKKMKNRNFISIFVLKKAFFWSIFRKKIAKNTFFRILKNPAVTLLRLWFLRKCKKQNWNIFIFVQVDSFGVFAFGGHFGLIPRQPVDQNLRNLTFCIFYDTTNNITSKVIKNFQYSGK